MKSAIVTGGTGFIGSMLVKELCKNDIRVTIITRNRKRVEPEIICNPNCKIVDGEIEKLNKNDFQEREYDVFFHLGWSGVSTNLKNDIKIQLNNIEMSLQALELAKKIGCKKFVAAGTVAEYVFCNDIMNVNEKQTPNDMYGAAKVSTHYFLEVRARQMDMPFIWMVIPSTYGEGRKDNNIITYTIRSLINGEVPLYGDLEQMWDFLYVEEVARAIRYIGEKGRAGKVYGIGSGEYKKLREYIEIIRDIIDPQLELGIGKIPKYSKQTFSSCVSILELTRDTGFKPQIGFEEGIRLTIESFR